MTTVTLKPKQVLLAVTCQAAFDPFQDPLFIHVEPGTGSTYANSYVALAKAKQYFIGKRLFSSAWTVASDDDKIVALKQATAVLDREFSWSGSGPLVTNQALGWPRLHAIDRYQNAVTGVPVAVRDAACELAFYLLAQDRLVARDGIGLKSLKVDVISLVFDKVDGPETFPSYISRMLNGYGFPIRAKGNILNVALYRV